MVLLDIFYGTSFYEKISPVAFVKIFQEKNKTEGKLDSFKQDYFDKLKIYENINSYSHSFLETQIEDLTDYEFISFLNQKGILEIVNVYIDEFSVLEGVQQ